MKFYFPVERKKCSCMNFIRIFSHFLLVTRRLLLLFSLPFQGKYMLNVFCAVCRRITLHNSTFIHNFNLNIRWVTQNVLIFFSDETLTVLSDITCGPTHLLRAILRLHIHVTLRRVLLPRCAELTGEATDVCMRNIYHLHDGGASAWGKIRSKTFLHRFYRLHGRRARRTKAANNIKHVLFSYATILRYF